MTHALTLPVALFDDARPVVEAGAKALIPNTVSGKDIGFKSNQSTTQIYTHVLDERMKAMVRDLHPLTSE